MSEKKLTVSVCTLGCRVNQYESRAICEYLEQHGAQILDFSEKCDVYIINTCAVTAESERKSRQMARRANKLNPQAPIVMTGCQAQLNPDAAARLPMVKYVGGNTSKLEAARAALALGLGESFPCLGQRGIGAEYENYSVLRPDHTRAYIKIEDGCENRCAYCVIPKVRGPVRSKPAEDVIKEVKNAVSLGYKEIVLTGIEISSYQHSLPGLINTLSALDGLERIRLSSVNPSYINKKFTDSLNTSGKLCPHFHLSLQSCCDRTLNAMRRRYNTKMLFENCGYLRTVMPNVCFTADIICGFPGESDEDFAVTLENTKKLRLLHAHIFPYSKRPGTEAAEMPLQVEDAVKNERCAALAAAVAETRAEIVSGFYKNGQKFTALFETESDGYLHGHTENYLPVKLKSGSSIPLLSRTATVMLVSETEICGEFEVTIVQNKT